MSSQHPRQRRRSLLRLDIFSIQVEVTEDLVDKVGLRQMAGIVINSINVDPQKIFNVPFFGYVQPHVLDVGDDLF